MQPGSKVQREFSRKEALATLDRSYNVTPGVVKINAGNTFEHELAKFCVAWEMAQLGKQFVTEAIFIGGKRADILVLDDVEAIEIQKSESDESIEIKKMEYPVMLRAMTARKVLGHALRSVMNNILEYNREIKEKAANGNRKNM